MSGSPAGQADTIAFLMRADAYGAAVGHVERVDTHGAIVFLTETRAYKLKRAVKLPYFDFTTPQKRREVCERELAINRRTAPSLYLDVVAIHRDAGGALSFEGEGEAVDWVLVMKRFPEAAVLARLSAAGRLDPALMPRLARTIRRFHAEAERVSDASWLAALARILETLDETLLGRQAAPLALGAAPALAALRRELHARSPLLLERQADGYVRRCHGDLHLRNIVLLDGEPVLFDAIEFDENLATIDVLYDLAFLLMDLWHRGARAEANAVLGVYVEGDALPAGAPGLRLLALFLSLRAAIRAMVSVHALAVLPEARRGEAEQDLRAYTALSRDLLHPRPTVLICVGGLSGTGKTTVARGLAPTIGAVPGAIILRSDVERKLMLGVEPETHLPPDAYREDVDREVYQRVFDKTASILAAGHAAIIDAGFRHPAQQDAAARLASKAGASFRGLWLQAGADEMIARVEQRRNDASDAGRDVVLRQLRSPAPPTAPGWAIIDASGGPDQTLTRARQALA